KNFVLHSEYTPTPYILERHANHSCQAIADSLAFSCSLLNSSFARPVLHIDVVMPKTQVHMTLTTGSVSFTLVLILYEYIFRSICRRYVPSRHHAATSMFAASYLSYSAQAPASSVQPAIFRRVAGSWRARIIYWSNKPYETSYKDCPDHHSHHACRNNW